MDKYIKREDALKIIDNYSKAVTEEGKVVVEAIKDIIAMITPTADVVPKSEVERLIALNSQLEEKFFEERGKVERLHGILLQFTDIVHKWGTKNNIDTSEISLVPIMNEEADSIIQKAKQEVAREIFEEIENLFFNHFMLGEISLFEDKYAELKKKYTEVNDDKTDNHT